MTDIEQSNPATGFTLETIAATNRGVEIIATPDTEDAKHILLAMADACGQMLDGHEAQNYVEFQVTNAGTPTYLVRVQRVERPTPHALRRAAEDRAERAEAALDAAEGTKREAIEHAYHATSRATRAEAAVRRARDLADVWDTYPCVCGHRIANGNDDSSQCLSCAADTLRAFLDGTPTPEGDTL